MPRKPKPPPVAPAPSPVSAQWWRVDAPINTVIPASPALDPKSSTWASYVAAGAKFLNVGDYGVPIYAATSDTKRWSLAPKNYPAWGPNPFAGYSVPVDMSWRTVPSADGHLVVIDGDLQFDFYDMDLSGTVPVFAWGGVSRPTTKVITCDGNGNATGSGISRGAGVIRQEEMGRGYIDHALVFSTDVAAAAYRFPAKRTDGINMRGVTYPIPEGTRMQLDPAINVDASTTMRPHEKIVAKALQKYGAYVIDNGGGTCGFSCELPHDAVKTSTGWVLNSPAYASVGIDKDYKSLTYIPWGAVRFLAL